MALMVVAFGTLKNAGNFSLAFRLASFELCPNIEVILNQVGVLFAQLVFAYRSCKTRNAARVVFYVLMSAQP
jgi:hypothetical protein